MCFQNFQLNFVRPTHASLSLQDATPNRTHQIDGAELFDGCKTRSSIDSNRENDKIHTYDLALATAQDAERAIATAVADPDGWRSMTYLERNAILSKVAMELRTSRGDLMGAAAIDTGKIFSEADVEISEAVDFAE